MFTNVYNANIKIQKYIQIASYIHTYIYIYTSMYLCRMKVLQVSAGGSHSAVLVDVDPIEGNNSSS